MKELAQALDSLVEQHRLNLITNLIAQAMPIFEKPWIYLGRITGWLGELRRDGDGMAASRSPS
ncbi:MAG: hypothetical protein KME52_18440 [Desmonostoc geniculatum HA4340-LM1]|nr:hypothetical protein [Desmonostoc geniculatum HA4340-LM1]